MHVALRVPNCHIAGDVQRNCACSNSETQQSTPKDRGIEKWNVESGFAEGDYVPRNGMQWKGGFEEGEDRLTPLPV